MPSLKKASIAYLKIGKASTKVSSKYANFANIFSPKLAVELPKYKGINNHTIKLVDNSQFSYGFIYHLGLIKLEILKIYIKNNLGNNFIKLFKFLVRIPIFFKKKTNEGLRLCVNYQSFNNLTIKN